MAIPQKLMYSCWAAAIEMATGGATTHDYLVEHEAGYDLNLGNLCSAGAGTISDYIRDIKKDKTQIFEMIEHIEPFEGYLFYFSKITDGQHVVFIKLDDFGFNFIKCYDSWPTCQGNEYFLTLDCLTYMLDGTSVNALINNSSIARELDTSLIPPIIGISYLKAKELISGFKNYYYENIGFKNELRSFLNFSNSNYIYEGLAIKIYICRKNIVFDIVGWFSGAFPFSSEEERNFFISAKLDEQYLIPFLDCSTSKFCFGIRINTIADNIFIINKAESVVAFNKYSFKKPRLSASKKEAFRLLAEMPESIETEMSFSNESQFLMNSRFKIDEKMVIIELPEIAIKFLLVIINDQYLVFDVFNCLASFISPQDDINLSQGFDASRLNEILSSLKNN